MKYLLIYEEPRAMSVDPPDISSLGFRHCEVEFGADSEKAAAQWVTEFTAIGTIKVRYAAEVIFATIKNPAKLHEVPKRRPLLLVKIIDGYRK